MSVGELNESDPYDDVPKGYMLTKLLVPALIGKTVMDKPHTDYRSTGIEAAGILHRLLYGT